MKRRLVAKACLLGAVLCATGATFSATAAAAGDASPSGISLGPSALKITAFEQKAERGILTPVPLELEVPAELHAWRVLVHYRIHGSKEWNALELRRQGARWSGAIPCLEVSTITGDIRFYIRVHDEKGGVIAFSGSRAQPYRIAIVHDSLRAGVSASEQRCPDPSDCPPGLLGCPSAAVEKIPCTRNSDCEGSMTCGWDGYCEDDTRRRHWLSLAAEYGVGFAAATGACSVPSQENNGYACYRPRDGQTYTGNPVYRNESIAMGSAPLRAWLGYEHLIEYQHTLGVRVGYAFSGAGPTPRGGTAFLPYSGEVRVSHYFGNDPFARAGLKSYAFLGGGYAMYDIKMRSTVREDTQNLAAQGANDLEQTLDVWKRAGDIFIDLGAGVVFVSQSGLGASFEVTAAELFPFGALVVTGSVGVRAGF